MKPNYLRATRDLKENIYQAHCRALIELAQENERIVICYADFPSVEAGEFFKEHCPDRYIDVGIAEGHLITAAAGLSNSGFIPFTHCHTLFALGRGYNQIRQNVAYDRNNVKIILCNSGVIWGGIGPSHHSVEDIAALRAVPNLVILSPADAVSTGKTTRAAVEYEGPVVIRLPFIGETYPTIYTEELKYEIGKSLLLRHGTDVAILAVGSLVNDALEASEMLEDSGIFASVLDIHTIKPIDEEAIVSAATQTGAVVTVEDASIIGGLGGAVAELLSDKWPVPVKRIGVNDSFGESGKSKELKEHYKLTSSSICAAAKAAIAAKQSRLNPK
ncbi:MAG: transketolase family protein [Deltaproteobacteria bacterium]|nr:transketolase family protein [Deltaproteobacteria bacterium]